MTLMAETTALPVIHSETVRLIGWGSIESLADQIACRLFGEMVQLATPVVKEFHSDLYRDAAILAERIVATHNTEPFAYVVRPSGTHLGTIAEHAMHPSAWQRGSKGYVVTLIKDERETWFARFDLIKQD